MNSKPELPKESQLKLPSHPILICLATTAMVLRLPNALQPAFADGVIEGAAVVEYLTEKNQSQLPALLEILTSNPNESIFLAESTEDHTVIFNNLWGIYSLDNGNLLDGDNQTDSTGDGMYYNAEVETGPWENIRTADRYFSGTLNIYPGVGYIAMTAAHNFGDNINDGSQLVSSNIQKTEGIDIVSLGGTTDGVGLNALLEEAGVNMENQRDLEVLQFSIGDISFVLNRGALALFIDQLDQFKDQVPDIDTLYSILDTENPATFNTFTRRGDSSQDTLVSRNTSSEVQSIPSTPRAWYGWEDVDEDGHSIPNFVLFADVEREASNQLTTGSSGSLVHALVGEYPLVGIKSSSTPFSPEDRYNMSTVNNSDSGFNIESYFANVFDQSEVDHLKSLIDDIPFQELMPELLGEYTADQMTEFYLQLNQIFDNADPNDMRLQEEASLYRVASLIVFSQASSEIGIEIITKEKIEYLLRSAAAELATNQSSEAI